MRTQWWHRALPGLLLLAAMSLAGCGGGKSVAPPGTGGTGTVRGTVSLPPGQSASDVVVRVEGTSLQAHPAADGSFEIRGVPAGSHTLSAVAPATNLGAHVPVSVGAGTDVRVEALQLEPGGQIAGIVTAYDAQGVRQVRAGAAITARPMTDYPVLTDGTYVMPPSGGQLPEVDADVRLTATSGADGTYAIKGVPPGAYWLAATLEGFPAQETYIYVSVAATSPGDFVFGTPVDPGIGTITGRVTGKGPDGTSVPVAEAQVWVDVPYGWAEGGYGWSGAMPPNTSDVRPVPPVYYMPYTTTAEDGTYTLTLPRGSVTVQCRHRDYMPAKADVLLGASATLDFTLERAPGTPPSLQLTASVGQTTYNWGDPVALSMVLTNTGVVPVALTFQGNEASFSVYRGEQPVWSYGSWWGPMPMAAERKRGRDVLDAVLQPGGTREYRVSWNQRAYDGVIVDPGTYSLRGSVYTPDVMVEAEPVSFQIVRP